MHESYPAVYRDAQGKEQTIIENDGKQLRMVVRGVEFVGTMFDDFEPTTDPTGPGLASFTLRYGMLAECRVECLMPMPVVSGKELTEAELRIYAQFGWNWSGADPNVPSRGLRLCLSVGGALFWSRGRGGWFEDELRDIQQALPEGIYLKCCFSCAFSDYHPAGNGIFGCMACFRGNKEAYRKVMGKHDLFAVWDTMTGWVQETYLCPDYEHRRPGAGYRG